METLLGNLFPRTLLGNLATLQANLFLELLLGNLRHCSWNLGNLFLGTLLGNCFWNPCLGTCSWEPDLEIIPGNLLANLFLVNLTGNLVLRVAEDHNLTLLGKKFPSKFQGRGSQAGIQEEVPKQG